VSSSQDELLYRDLTREDDVGLVLRGLLHIEHQLIDIANAVLPLGERCEWDKFAYHLKVELAYSCGLPQDVRGALLKLGKLRNDFAHKLDAVISKQSALDLYNCLSARHRTALQDSYKVMVNEPVFSLGKIEPRDLVTLIFLNMHSATKAAALALQRSAS
jgi:hypothetical protein